MDDLKLASLRAKALEQDKSFGVTRLRDEFKMKPKPDAVPSDFVKSPYNRKRNPIYKIADCVPLRVRKTTDKPSEKQVLSRQISGLKAKLRSNMMQASLALASKLNSINRDQLVFLDTETTGLTHDDQVIELAIVDFFGDILFNSRFSPSCSIHPRALAVHGISPDMLQGLPRWPDQCQQIKAALKDKIVVIFNAPFDLAMMQNTCNAFDLEDNWLLALETWCAMKEAAKIFGATNSFGTISLSDAVYAAGLDFEGDAHAALCDAQMTRLLFRAMTQLHRPLSDKIAALESKKAAMK